jgi:hypothetical protein
LTGGGGGGGIILYIIYRMIPMAKKLKKIFLVFLSIAGSLVGIDLPGSYRTIARAVGNDNTL